MFHGRELSRSYQFARPLWRERFIPPIEPRSSHSSKPCWPLQPMSAIIPRRRRSSCRTPGTTTPGRRRRAPMRASGNCAARFAGWCCLGPRIGFMCAGLLFPKSRRLPRRWVQCRSTSMHCGRCRRCGKWWRRGQYTRLSTHWKCNCHFCYTHWANSSWCRW